MSNFEKPELYLVQVKINQKAMILGISAYNLTKKQSVVWKPENSYNAMFYPNPANGYFNFVYSVDAPGAEIAMEVCDIAGKVLMRKQMQEAKGQAIIGVDELPTGSYLVNLVVNGSISSTQKLNIINK